MKIKNVLNNTLFCGVIFLCIFFGVTFGDNCDEISHQMENKLNEHNQCYSGCVNNNPNCDQACQTNCNEVVCESTYTAYNNLVNQYNSCFQTTGVDGPIFVGSWDGGDSFSVLVSFSKHAPGYMGGLNQELHCSAISVNGGTASIIEQGLDKCNISISNITNDTVTINVPSNVCFLGSYSNNAGSQTYTRPGENPEGQGEDPEGEGEDPETEPDSNPENISCDCQPDDDEECNHCGGNYYFENNCCVLGDLCYHPANDSGFCEDGYANDGNGCCSQISQLCTGNLYSSDGGNCGPCEEGTIPNESHTKCICDSSKKCCGIQLNTVVPFIGDCIEMNTDSSRGDTTSVTSVTAFPILVQGLMKILMSAIMVFSFLMVIIAGLAMITGAFGGSGYNKGKTIIKNVIISLILLGCSGLILSLINPSFFGG